MIPPYPNRRDRPAQPPVVSTEWLDGYIRSHPADIGSHEGCQTMPDEASPIPWTKKSGLVKSQAPLRGGNLTIINHRLCLWLAPVPPGYIPGRVYPIARRMVYQPHRFHGQALKGLSYRITRKRAYRFPDAHLVICIKLLRRTPGVALFIRNLKGRVP